jgi:hypothetical protein
MKHTNPMLDEHDSAHKKLTEGELLRFMGYMLSLSIHCGIPLDNMTAPEGSTAAAPAMGRFGLAKNRFDTLRSKLRCGPSDDAFFEENDWCFVEPLLTAFNSTMQATVHAGWLIGCDESMSAWRGKQGKCDPKKIPKLQFVKRKPEPLGS